jgi:hypothetical protein
MTHPNKVKGDKWERDVRDYLRGKGLLVDRIPAGSTDDLGDLWLPHPGPVVQCKNHARLDLAGFCDEMNEQRQRAGRATGFVAVKRRGKSVEHAYLITTMALGWELLS